MRERNGMKTQVLVLAVALLVAACSNTTERVREKEFTSPPERKVVSVKRDYAAEANENPFIYGQLNPLYEGEKTALRGQVIDIKPTKEKYPLYKLEVGLEGISPIWVTSIGPSPPNGIQLGDIVIFRGFIATTSRLDSSGEVEKMISSKTLLMAIQSEMVKEYPKQ